MGIAVWNLLKGDSSRRSIADRIVNESHVVTHSFSTIVPVGGEVS
jgi:hypothetical protein